MDIYVGSTLILYEKGEVFDIILFTIIWNKYYSTLFITQNYKNVQKL